MMNRRIKSNVYRLLLAAGVCLALGSCGDEAGDAVPQVPANPDALCALTPHGVEICPVDESVAPITRSATGEPEQKATYAENLGHNFSAEATLEAEPRDARTRAGANLAAGAQYRIVVFNTAGAIVGNVVYKQGSADVVSGEAIRLKAGVYRLFAYTFNSASTIRGLDADNRNVTVNSGDDFMTYTNPAFTISSTDYGSGIQLNISFTRQCARLTVRIIVEGYDDNTVTAASLTVRYAFGSGSKWDGTTNTDASTLPSTDGTASIVKASANDTLVDCGSSADNPYLIAQPFTDQNISVSGLSVTIQGVGTKNLPDFTFPNPVTLVKGGSYRLTIHTGNYYVLSRTNPVEIGGLKWARTNLQQTGAGVTAPVSFVANPWDYGSYWNWGMRDATVYGNDIFLHGDGAQWNSSADGDPNQDPCRSLPGSNWHVPTKDEHTVLNYRVALKDSKVRVNGTIYALVDYGWGNVWEPDLKGTVYVSDNRVLFLPSAGLRSQYQGESYYWTSTSGGNDGSIPMAYGMFCNRFSLTILERGFGRQFGCTLRCVQD